MATLQSADAQKFDKLEATACLCFLRNHFPFDPDGSDMPNQMASPVHQCLTRGYA